MSYEKWQQRVRGEKVPTFLLPDELDEGYYRKPINIEKLPNGRKRVLSWAPVAIWHGSNGVMTGLIGTHPKMQELTQDQLSDESWWSWVVQHPISYQDYQRVAEEGEEWPTEELPEMRMVSENVEPPKDDKPKDPETAEEFKAAIELVIASAKNAAVDSNEAASIIAGTCNRLAELRLACKHAGEAAYKPHYAAYTTAYNLWTPPVKTAEAEEKRLNRLILVFREKERQRLADQAAADAKIRQDEEETAQRVADRAIANGEPPAQAELPVAPPEPPPVAAPTRVTPTYGKRKVREQLQTFAEIDDFDAVYAFFKETEEVKTVLKVLAEAHIRAGRAVPGARKREGLV